MTRDTWSNLVMLLAGSALIVVGALLPWMNSWRDVTGLDVLQGQVTFSLGLVMATAVIARVLSSQRTLDLVLSGVCLGASIVVFILAFDKMQDIRAFENLNATAFITTTLGSGVPVTLAGASISGVGAAGDLLANLPKPALVSRTMRPR